MRLLLDSHVILWALFQPQQLSKKIAAIIDDSAATILVSPVSIYELELKKGNGRLPFPHVPDWAGMLATAKYTLLALTPGAAQAATRLPPHHKDPWDRLLIAQAQFDGATLATKDKVILRYGVSTLW